MIGAKRAEHTQDPVDPAIVAADVTAVLNALEAGGIAVIPTCLTYAVVGSTPDAIESIFRVKARSYAKPCGLFGSPAWCTAVHDLPREKHTIARELEAAGLPFSVVAPFRAKHPLLTNVDPQVIARSSKDGTMDMVVSGGPFMAALAVAAMARGIAVFGSSANRSLGGSRYRLADVDAPIREAAALALDYGTSRYADAAGLSSTIIDFRDFSVVRVGHRFADLEAAFRSRFGVVLRPAMAA